MDNSTSVTADIHDHWQKELESYLPSSIAAGTGNDEDDDRWFEPIWLPSGICYASNQIQAWLKQPQHYYLIGHELYLKAAYHQTSFKDFFIC